MSSLKLRKIAKIVKEINVDPSQARYDIAGLTLGLCKFFYRTPQNLFQDLNIGDYTIDTSNNSQVLVIQNNELLRIMEVVQVCYILDITSSKYETDFNVDINQLKDEYNNLVDDVHALWDYIKKVGIVADDTSIPLILPQLNTDEVWVKTEDGYKGISLTDAEGIIKGVIEEYTSLMEKRLDAYVEDPLKPKLNEHVETVNKPELDRYVEETNKPALDDYTTQLEERLQAMIDQAVADKGLMPPNKDWFDLEFGNYLVTDIFSKNYTNLPPTLSTTDKDGVVKVNIVDNGRTQVIRYYTTTGKMFFAVKANDVWSEWQELGERTDTMQFTQANHGFVFTAVTLDGATRKWVKANKYTSADGIAIKIDNDRFDVVTRGVVNIPTQARDDKGNTFVYDEYYFLSQEVDGGFSRTKNEIGTFQYLAHISEIDGKQVAYIDIGDSYDLDYEVVDNETADRVGIGTYKTTLRTADTIEDLKRLNLKVGDVIEVLGYYTKGDGANHKRKIENSDDGSGILLNNGLYANIIHNGEVNVSWFGACKDEYSDNELEKVFNFSKNKNNKVFAVTVDGYVKISRGVNLTKTYNLKIKGKYGKRYSSFSNTNNINGFELNGVDAYIDCVDSYAITFEDLIFNSIGDNETSPKCNILFGRSTSQTSGGNRVSNCEFKGKVQQFNIIFAGAEINVVENCIFLSGGDSKGIIALLTKNIGIISQFLTLQDNLISCSCNKFINNIFELYSVNDDSYVFYSNSGELNTTIEGGFVYNGDNSNPTGMFKMELYNNAPACELTIRNLRREGVNVKELLKIINRKNEEIFVDGVEISNVFTPASSSGYRLIDVQDNIKMYAFRYVGNTFYTVVEEEERKTIKIKTLVYSDIRTNDGTILQSDSIINSYIALSTKSSYIESLLTNYKPYGEFNEFRGSYIQNGSGKNTYIGCNISTPLRRSGTGEQRPNKVQPFLELNDAEFFIRNTDKKAIFYLKEDGNWYYADGTLAYNDSGVENYALNVLSLNTPYHTNKMAEEGGTTLTDFYSYLDEKYAYDKQLEEEEQAKYEAYQKALTTNPNLTYEEFVASYPMMLPVRQEPTIPQSVQEFMKKYL